MTTFSHEYKKDLKDDSPFPWTNSKHYGKKMANVPASYLLWLHENEKGFGNVGKYIRENLDVIKKQAEEEKNNFKKGK